jgi:hypothetical protein
MLTALILVATAVLGAPASATSTTPSCTLLPARSAAVNGEVFLGGDFIELGLSAKGSWGSRNAKPSGFRGTNPRANVGMGADLDGYCATPTDNVDMPIDFFLPGSPEERWGVSFTEGGVRHHGSFSELRSDNSSAGVTGTHTISNESSGDLLAAKVISLISLGGLEKLRVTATHSFQKTQAYFTTTVVVENLSGAELSDVRYHRSFDPDNAVDRSGGFTTTNTILSQFGTDRKSVVQAKLQPSDLTALALSGGVLERLLTVSSITTEIPIIFFSSDPESVAYRGGFTNPNPYQPFGGTDPFVSPQATGTSSLEDAAIGIIVRRPSLAAGASTSAMRYVTSLDSRDFSAVETELVAAAEGTEAEDAAESEPVVADPPRLVLPRVDGYSVRLSSANVPVLRFEGVRFWCISSVQIDGASFQFNTGYNFEGNEFLTVEVPRVTPGTRDLVFESCMGRMSFHNWLVIPSLDSTLATTSGVKTEVPPVSTWHKAEIFGLDDALRSKIFTLTQNLGADYSRVRCIVNSRNGEELNRAFAAEICAYAKSSNGLTLESFIQSRDSFAGNGYWINIWVSSSRG